MARTMHEGLRDGQISLKVAHFSNKTLRETRVQPSKMAKFEDKSKNDEYRPTRGKVGKTAINEKQYQHTVKGMPTKDRGAVKSPYGKSRGSHFSEGSGGVVGHEQPSNDHIDDYPPGQKKTFPAGARYAGGPSNKTGNTKMKGKEPAKSGGPDGGNAREPRYYGGPNRRPREDQ